MKALSAVRCRVCGCQRLSALLDFGLQPISNRFRTQATAPDPRFPLALQQCESCGLIQLVDPPPHEELLPRFSWLKYNEPEGHLDQLTDQIINFCNLEPDSNIWGITFKDDTLLQRLGRRGYSRTFRLDPAEDLGIAEDGAGVETIQSRLTPGIAKALVENRGAPRLIIARHILEHVQDIQAFILLMRELLAPDGFLVIEVPDCALSFKRLDYTIVWEEHVSYFTAATLPAFFHAAGAVALSTDIVPLGHESLLVAILQMKGAPEDEVAHTNLSAERETAASFAAQFPKVRDQFANALEKCHQRGEKVAITGAGHLACAFVNYLKLEGFIAFLVDDNPNKQGLYLPGTMLSVRDAGALQSENVGLCLLSVAPEVEQRVIDRNRAFLDRGGRFASIFTASERSLIQS